MQIKSKMHNYTLYILICGELDEHTASFARKHIDTILDTEKGYNQVIMDLSELSFMDSTGIGVLIGRYKKMSAKSKPIYICNPSYHAEKIFKMSGLYDIMPKIS